MRTMDQTAIPPHYSAMLNIEQVCVYLGGISERKVWSMVSAGEIPKPIKMGSVSRWRRADLDAWIENLE